jgi:hypothetical protein
MTADLPQICRFEGVEEIWSEKKNLLGGAGCVDDWKLLERGRRRGASKKRQRRLLEATREWL